MFKRLYFTLPWLALALAGFIIAQETLGFWRTSRLPLAGIQAESGFCHTAPIPDALVRPSGGVGRLSLFEDGRPLWPVTADINGARVIGHGYYCCSGSTLYFSASDNSDPATGHHRYEISGPREFPAWATPASLALLAASYIAVFFVWPCACGASRWARAWEATALTLVLSIGALWRAQMPRVPFVWPDSWLYMSMSFNWEAHHQLWPTEREFGYQTFILGVMGLFENPAALAIIQHALGLASAGLLFVAVQNLRHIVPVRPWVQAITGLVALGTAMAWGLSTISCYYEQYLMPEAVFPFVAAAALALATAAMRSSSARQGGAFRTGFLASGAASLMFLMYSTIPRWGFGVLLGPVVLYAAMRRGIFSRARRIRLWLAPFLAIGMLVVIPEMWLHRRHDPGGNVFLQMHLLCIHANVVRGELSREAALPHPRYPRELLARIGADIDREFQRYNAVGGPNGPSPSLGFDPAQLLYQDSVMTDLDRAYPKDPQKIRAFCVYFYVQAWRHQPIRMLRKISDEMTLVFAHPRSLFDADGFEFLTADDIPLSRHIAEDEISGRRFVGGWKTLPRLLSGYEHDEKLYTPPTAARIWHDISAAAYLPVLAACILWTGWSLARPGAAANTDAWTAVAPVALLGFAGNLLSCLTIAIVHSLDPSRYRDSQMVFSLYAVAGGFVALIIAFDVFLTTRRRSPSPVAP